MSRFLLLRKILRSVALIALCASLAPGVARAQHPPNPPSDPAYALLDRAYAALRANEYDHAIAAFEQAIALAPDRAAIHKDLAYALLKTGENQAARDQFAEAARLDPKDEQAALEYAFLCYETKQPVQARRTFDRLRASHDSRVASTAAAAFENIDRPLREGIERWKQALVLSPDNFSAHEELAKLAEQRDEIPLAAEHYEKAWRLRPDRRDLLLDLGRAWKQMNHASEANGALLAASRGTEPRVAEQARELLPDRYPYVSEFEAALALDPANAGLRRDLAFLEIQMNRPADAEQQFAAALDHSPDDLISAAQLGLLRLARGDRQGAMPLLERVMAGPDRELAERVRAALRMPDALHTRSDAAPSGDAVPAKEMAERSLEKGYLKDALKYLNAAHENDPVDFEVMLKLGRTYNILKDDRTAVQWFDLARRSPDPAISSEAARSYRNLTPEFERFRTTLWAFPTFSTRWHDLFAYAQIKTEWMLPHSWIHPYASIRFVGDAHGAESPGFGFAPQYLSEQSAITGLGVATRSWHAASAWFEAGEAFRFLPSTTTFVNGVPVTDLGRAVPDYRGGLTYAKGFGRGRLLAETNDDFIYVHRFDRDTLLYTQNRFGYKASRVQMYWNVNLTTDIKREYWANFYEMGPGVRFKPGEGPFRISIDAVHGVYLVNAGNPRGPEYNDLRIGVWYARTR